MGLRAALAAAVFASRFSLCATRTVRRWRGWWITIARAADFIVAHSAVSPGRFIVQINQGAPAPVASLVCLFPVDQPSATVPATALAHSAGVGREESRTAPARR